MKLIPYLTGIDWLKGLHHQAATDLRRAHTCLLHARMEHDQARHEAEILGREVAVRESHE